MRRVRKCAFDEKKEETPDFTLTALRAKLAFQNEVA